MNLRLVITGTDTGVGKTIFCAAICNALQATYWKPVQSGLVERTDSETVADLALLPPQRIWPEAWRLHTPASPHLSAQIDGVQIRPDQIRLPQTEQPMVIEGVGGLMVPLNNQCLFVDWFAKWQFPTVLCARTTLGTINHTLLSLEAMRHRHIPVLGVAFIGDANEDNETIIAKLGQVKRLGRLPYLKDLTPANLARGFSENFRLQDFKETC